MKNITNFVNLERELLKRNRELMMINTLSSAFMSSDNMDKAMENLLKKVLLITELPVGMLLLKEETSLRLKAFSGISPELKRAVEAGLFDHFCAEIEGRGEPLDIVDSSRLLKMEPLTREGVVFIVVVPLSFEKDVIGFLLLGAPSESKKYHDFDFASLLSVLGSHISLI
jgi:transcriptional regulator with GAF, ATPase, and Fis domain